MIRRRAAREESQPLFFAEKIDGGWFRQQASLGATLDQLYYGLPALFAVAQSPFVHVHADKLVGQFGVHVAGELHGIVQSFFAVLYAVGNTVADGLGDMRAQVRPEGGGSGITANREGETGLPLPQETNDT